MAFLTNPKSSKTDLIITLSIKMDLQYKCQINLECNRIPISNL